MISNKITQAQLLRGMGSVSMPELPDAGPIVPIIAGAILFGLLGKNKIKSGIIGAALGLTYVVIGFSQGLK